MGKSFKRLQVRQRASNKIAEEQAKQEAEMKVIAEAKRLAEEAEQAAKKAAELKALEEAKAQEEAAELITIEEQEEVSEEKKSKKKSKRSYQSEG